MRIGIYGRLGFERRGVLALIAATALLLGFALVVAPKASASSDCIDTFNCYSLAEAENGNLTFTAAKSFSLTTDISSFDLQSGERANCAGTGGQIFWGNNSAWYRFDAGVAGTLSVKATTASDPTPFPVMLIEYQSTHEGYIDYTSNADLTSFQCSAHANSVGLGDPPMDPPMDVYTNGPTFVQVLAYCGEASSNPCASPQMGGPVTLQFSFTPTDSDGDGVPDSVDACPTIPAATANGCPPAATDTDGDGIPDVLDACPLQIGPASTDGCPDTDGDGIADKYDLCPKQRGPARTQGCPDADGDGVPDKDDKCPNTFAVVGYSTIGDGHVGCPEPLSVEFPYNVDYATADHDILQLLRVVGPPPRARITVTCSGHGCPKRTLVSMLTKSSDTVNLLPRLRKTGLNRKGQVWLLPGTRLTVSATFKGALGTWRSIIVPNDVANVRTTTGCLRGAKQIRCPT